MLDASCRMSSIPWGKMSAHALARYEVLLRRLARPAWPDSRPRQAGADAPKVRCFRRKHLRYQARRTQNLSADAHDGQDAHSVQQLQHGHRACSPSSSATAGDGCFTSRSRRTKSSLFSTTTLEVSVDKGCAKAISGILRSLCHALSASVWVPGSSMCQATGSSRECPRLHCCEASRTSRCRKLAAVRPDTRSLCMKSSEWPLRSRLFSRPVRAPHQQLSAVMREFLQRPPSPNRTVNVSLLRNELGSALTIFLRSQPYRMCDVDDTTLVERLNHDFMLPGPSRGGEKACHKAWRPLRRVVAWKAIAMATPIAMEERFKGSPS